MFWLVALVLVISSLTEVNAASEYYCIQHAGGRFLSVASDGILRLTAACSTKFMHLNGKSFQMEGSDKCMEPDNGNNDAHFRMKSGCGPNSVIEVTLEHTLKHVASGKYIHPYGGSIYPTENTPIVLHVFGTETKLHFRLVHKHYCIQHFSGLHVTIGTDKTTLMLSKSCESAFVVLPNNVLRLANSDNCMEPVGSHQNSQISVKPACGDNSRFVVTAGNSLKHVNTGKCIHPGGGQLHPSVNTLIVTQDGCDEQRLQFKFVEVNLAFGKGAIQSSTGYSGLANKAVDGDVNPHYPSGSCTHTYNNQNAWWRVDLGSEQRVCTVIVTNRGDCCQTRLNNFDVFVGNVDGSGGVNNAKCGTVGTAQTTNIVKCSSPLYGRYVFIRLQGSNFLTVCEVQVYSVCHAGSAETFPLRYSSAYEKCIGGIWHNQFGKTTLPAMPCGVPCPTLAAPMNSMVVHGKHIAVVLCKAGSYPSSFPVPAYYNCKNGAWVDGDDKAATPNIPCSATKPPRGVPPNTFTFWTFKPLCGSAASQADGRSKLLMLGLCNKNAGCSNADIKIACG